MQLSENALNELARVHGFDTPMYPNDLSADRNVRALAAVINDVYPELAVPVMSNYEVAGQLKTAIVLKIDNWVTPVYFDKWGFVAHNQATTLSDQACIADTFAYVAAALRT